MIAVLVLLPLAAGLIILTVPSQILRKTIWMLTAIIHFVLVVYQFFGSPEPILGGWLALDSLGFIFLFILSSLFLLSSMYGIGYLDVQKKEAGASRNESERVFIACLLFFLATMSLVTVSQHMGLLWVAIEATTLASAPLIYFHRSPGSLEATWKYLLICSVGIALALLGTFFLAASTTVQGQYIPMVLPELIRAGGQLDSIWLRAAFIFLLVGYGTKMGLAPMHTWLPDAHSEAPSVASALLSGVLLNCAFLGILRSFQICAAAGEAIFAQNLLIIFGLLSMVLAAVFILNQPDYKRMLAYSSVEHMGILAFAVGLGPGASFFVLLHTINHSFTKAMLFFSAGNILSVYKTKQISVIQGLLRRIPMTGLLWLAGFLAITGTPPFGIFVSEFNILGVAINKGHFIYGAVFLFLLAVIFIEMGRSVLKMSYGPIETESRREKENVWMLLPPLILLVLILIFGVYLPDFMQTLLADGGKILGGRQ